MSNKPWLLLLLVLLASCLAGCTQWRYELGERLNEAHRQPLTIGTPFAEVMARLGPPLRMSSTASGYVMAWESWRVHEDSLGLSLGALGADFLSIDWGQTRIDGEFALVTFDLSRRVKASSYLRWDNDAGKGSAIQAFAGVVQLVDIEDILEALPQHTWGTGLLNEQPKALNRAAAPGLGDTGLQQRATPSGIGQRSLELD